MKKLLVIGPGPGWPERKQKEWESGVEATGIDIIPEFAPDYVMDIEETGGLTGEKDYYDEVEIHHVLEHIQSNKVFRRIMWDIHECLKQGGVVDICTPYWKDPSAVETYEHVRFFNENSFCNFYSNPFIKEMKLPEFELIVNEVRMHGNGGQEVHVAMRKPYENA